MELESPRQQPDTRRSNVTSAAPTPARRPAAVPDRLRPTQRDLAFKNFGVMDTGHQDKKSVATSVVINGSLLALVAVLSLTTKKMIEVSKVTTLTAPVIPKPEPPPPPVLKLPKPPIVKVEPPKPLLHPPVVEVPTPPKIQPPVIKAAPVPINTPAPPKAVSPPPAPKPVAIQIAQAASVANNNPHPSPIRLGSMTNPINNTGGPAVSPINLGRSGAPGMNAANSGLGNPSKISISGSGSPNGTNMAGHDNSVHVIRGLGNGVPGGTGPLNGKSAGAVQIATNNPPPVQIRPSVQATPPTAQAAPKVLYKPKPVYTADAISQHIEGTVQVKIHISANGAISGLSVTRGLGHGLDQSAIQAAQGIRFKPAVDANGNPVDWDGVVSIVFQLATS